MNTSAVSSSLKFLASCYIWPSHKEEAKPSKWFYIRYILMILATSICLVGSFLHLIFVSIPYNSFFHVAEDLITVTGQLGTYYYLSCFVPFQKVAYRLYLKISDFKSFGKPPDYDEHSMKLQYLDKAYHWTLNLVVLAFFCEPFFTRNMCEKQNAAENLEDVCGFVTAIWLPFTFDIFPIKQFLHIWQTASTLVTYKGCAIISYTHLVCIEHVIIRLWHLKAMFQEAINTTNVPLRDKRISKCLEYHKEIFELAKDIDKVYKNSMFVHVICSGVVFGIMSFSILTVGMSIKILSLLIAWLTAAAFASFVGQRLYDNSLSIAEVIFKTNWYDQDYKFQKDLIFVLMRTQKPIIVHAGYFSELTNLFILTVLKTSYSYMTLLKAANH